MALNKQTQTRGHILDQVKQIVLKPLEQMPVSVYLFGSWARQEEKRTSDIDVAVWSETILPIQTLMNIRFALEESTVPYNVDLIDLRTADQPLIDKVRREGLIWRDYKSD